MLYYSGSALVGRWVLCQGCKKVTLPHDAVALGLHQSPQLMFHWLLRYGSQYTKISDRYEIDLVITTVYLA